MGTRLVAPGNTGIHYQPGATVLLHDTARTTAPGAWRRTLAASDDVLAGWAARGITVGALRDHWSVTAQE